MRPDSLRLVLMLLVGVVIGLLLAPAPVDAQNPHVLFVASSAGPVPMAGSTAGVPTVTVQ